MMFSATTNMDPTTTGTRAIGDALAGRLHLGSLLIIEGDSGSGKSVFSQYLAYGSLVSGNLIAYYTTDGDCQDLIYQMESLNMKVMNQYVADLLRIYSLESVSSPVNSLQSLKPLINHINNLPKRFSLVVVDCLTPFMINLNSSSKVDVFLAFKQMCGKNRSIILVTHAHIFEKAINYRVLSMSDYYLKINSGNKIIAPGLIEERTIKTLEVCKIHGIELQKAEMIEFEIIPKVGINILPFFKVKI